MLSDYPVDPRSLQQPVLERGVWLGAMPTSSQNDAITCARLGMTLRMLRSVKLGQETSPDRVANLGRYP